MKLILNEHKAHLSFTYLARHFKKYRFAHFCYIIMLINFIRLSNTPENFAISNEKSSFNSNQISSNIFAYTFGLQQNKSFDDSKAEICLHIKHLFEKAPYTSNRIMILRIFDDFSPLRMRLIKETLLSVLHDLYSETISQEKYKGTFNENKDIVSILELTLDEFLLLFGITSELNSKYTNYERVNSIKNSLFCYSKHNTDLVCQTKKNYSKYLVLELKLMKLLVLNYESIFENENIYFNKKFGSGEYINLTFITSIKINQMLLGKFHLDLCNYYPAKITYSIGKKHMRHYFLMDKKAFNTNEEKHVIKKPHILNTSENVYIKSYNDFYELFPANNFILYDRYYSNSIYIKEEDQKNIQQLISIRGNQKIIESFGRRIVFQSFRIPDDNLLIIFNTIKEGKRFYRKVIIYKEDLYGDEKIYINLFEIQWNIDTNNSEMGINKVEQENDLIVLNRFIGYIYDFNGVFLSHKLFYRKNEYSTNLITKFLYVCKYNFSEMCPYLASTTFTEKTERIKNIKRIIMSLDSSIKLQIYKCEMDFNYDLEEEETDFDGIFGIHFKHSAPQKEEIYRYLKSNIKLSEEFMPTKGKDLMIKFDCEGQKYFFFVKYENTIIRKPTIDHINDDTITEAFLNVFPNENKEKARKIIGNKLNSEENKNTHNNELKIDLFFDLIKQIKRNFHMKYRNYSFADLKIHIDDQKAIINKVIKDMVYQNQIENRSLKMLAIQSYAPLFLRNIIASFAKMTHENYRMMIFTDKLGDAPIFNSLERALYRFRK